MPVVYIDILFFVNFFINRLIIYCTGGLMRIKMSRFRCLTASAISALYSVFMFFPDFDIFYTTIFKILFSLFIVALSYNIKSVRLFLKAVAYFYLVTVFFGGCVFLLFCFTDIGAKSGAIIKNGVIYFDIQWHILFLSVLISYALAITAEKYFLRRNTKTFLGIEIIYLGKSTHVTALVDTGNTLSDPITNEPVIVAEYESIKELLPPDFEKDVCISQKSNILTRMRVIPFSSVGKENGMLLGFKPDKITMEKDESSLEAKNVVIGISNTPLSKDRSFQALMPPGIFI